MSYNSGNNDFLIVDNNVIDIITNGIQGPPGGQGIQGIQGIQGTPGLNGANIVSELHDVNVATLINGSILIYSIINNSWNASTILTAQNIDAGEY